MNNTLFAKCANLRDDYQTVIHHGTTRNEFKKVMTSATSVMIACNHETSEIYDNGPKVHGARQQSRLDLISQWKELAERIFDSCETAMMKIIE